MILTLWLIFVLWAFKYYRPPKPKRKAPPGLTPQQIERNRKQAEREQAAAEKRQAQIEQAEIDIGHYTEVCALLEEELQSAQKQLTKAREKVKQDKIFELATNGKILEKHERELIKARKNVVSADTRYHAAQTKLNKAQKIIDSAGK